MVRDLDFSIRVVGHPTIRETDGLAMSSRNKYLTAEERARGAGDLRGAARGGSNASGSADILRTGRRLIEQIPGARIDYLELVDAETIEPARGFPPPDAACGGGFSRQSAFD